MINKLEPELEKRFPELLKDLRSFWFDEMREDERERLHNNQ